MLAAPTPSATTSPASNFSARPWPPCRPPGAPGDEVEPAVVEEHAGGLLHLEDGPPGVEGAALLGGDDRPDDALRAASRGRTACRRRRTPGRRGSSRAGLSKAISSFSPSGTSKPARRLSADPWSRYRSPSAVGGSRERADQEGHEGRAGSSWRRRPVGVREQDCRTGMQRSAVIDGVRISDCRVSGSSSLAHGRCALHLPYLAYRRSKQRATRAGSDPSLSRPRRTSLSGRGSSPAAGSSPSRPVSRAARVRPRPRRSGRASSLAGPPQVCAAAMPTLCAEGTALGGTTRGGGARRSAGEADLPRGSSFPSLAVARASALSLRAASHLLLDRISGAPLAPWR